MKKNIILSGVGGQGILSIATVIGEAATEANLYLKQAEVHGMSQRGGDVQSNLRLSTEEIYSDLIAKGKADIIIAMEPMEALRYVPYLEKDGWIITSSEPLINIPNYPNVDNVINELKQMPHVKMLKIEALAKENFIPKSANMILLGMAANCIDILSPEDLRNAIGKIFAAKGEKVVEDNYKAFDLGLQYSLQYK
ncbi:indolepyruvate oxidoreductase subunit beta [Phocaeicola oris]|uniref:indolepyruvate oxidoreductase subunit beta n=1 Tax=Phocaeicola oris TaxID=2896850 RepID=UPI00234F5A1F|nr:indolepyruvate oxidoreductase subunit beta [Phocaeicola oris]MCE2616461.1 indolepyruvate oxidoreductase subunit beta [Phocaeicola oris]